MGELIALLSAALYALSGVAIARGAAEARGGDNGAFLSVLLTAALSLALWLATGNGATAAASGGAAWAGVLLFVAAGLFSTVLGRLATFRAVERGGAVRASLLRRLIPVFAAAFALVLLAERPGGGAVAGMGLILAGAAMAGGKGPRGQAMRPGWALWGIGAAAAYGFAYVLRKMALGQLPAAALGALIGALTGIGWYLLAAAVRPPARRALAGALRGIGPWQILAASSMALAQIGQFLALARTSVAMVAVLGSLETLLSILLAGWVFRTEARPGPMVWAGAALSTAGILLIAL